MGIIIMWNPQAFIIETAPRVLAYLTAFTALTALKSRAAPIILIVLIVLTFLTTFWIPHDDDKSVK